MIVDQHPAVGFDIQFVMRLDYRKKSNRIPEIVNPFAHSGRSRRYPQLMGNTSMVRQRTGGEVRRMIPERVFHQILALGEALVYVKQIGMADLVKNGPAPTFVQVIAVNERADIVASAAEGVFLFRRE
jgi:hypothetical protein